ncbi:hypothetical protein M0804_006495 [Polistes exclamans]|nr:hypothetical protein M0804_006495 [Polistes exclamans]
MPMETEGHGREFGRRQKMRAKCTVEFVCKYCQRRFTKPYNLMIHERSHKDDVTFTCEMWVAVSGSSEISCTLTHTTTQQCTQQQQQLLQQNQQQQQQS